MVRVHDSALRAWPGARHVGPADLTLEIAATVWLRPRAQARIDRDRARHLGRTLPRYRAYDTRDALERSTDAAPGDVETVRAYCERYGIAVTARHWRSLRLFGSIGALCEAFGTVCDAYVDERDLPMRRRRGSLHLPGDLEPLVHALVGLDTWPHARSAPKRSPAKAAEARVPTPLSAADVARIYAFPKNPGTGQRIGILQLGGTFDRDDLEALAKLAGTRVPDVSTVRIDDAATHGTRETVFDPELLLDTQIAASLAPGADLVLYDAPHSERGFLDAVRTAIFDTRHAPQILSISYGQPEMLWTPAALEILDDLFAAAALLGISIFCASGDSGADLVDGDPHVRAPASSPFAHACGGTELALVDGAVVNETAWSLSGGGFSSRAPSEAWQSAAATVASERGIAPGRGVPDVVGQVVPGYRVVRHGTVTYASGTSAVAPMWAALTARINAEIGAPIGFFAPSLYAHEEENGVCRPIDTGANDFYRAGPGWNPCTGLGTPEGIAILRALSEPLLSADDP